MWGCYAKKYGVPRACMLAGNIGFELQEIFKNREPFGHHGPTGYIMDTYEDIAAVIEGFDLSSEDTDCDHAFIPSGCKLKDQSSQ